ncbi:hypothetical protein WJX79_005206 [Trebouxia sp. C0005]
MRDLVKSFAAVAWRSVFPRRAKPTQWSASAAAEQQNTVVSPLPQDSWVAADTDRGITWQTGSVETALGVPGLADGGDAHPVPVATEGAAATGHNPLAESLRQACRNNTITNGASVSPATTEAPDLDVPQTEDGIGDQSSAAGVDLAVPHTKDGTGERMFTAGVDLAVPHIEEGIGERALSAGVNLAVPHIKTGIGEQSFAAGVEQQHDSVLLEDASSVTTAKDGLESFDNRGLRRAKGHLKQQQSKASDRTERTVATQSRSDRHRVKDALGGQKRHAVKNPHDNALFRMACSQAEQEKLAKLELQITAIEAKAEICQANIKALTSPKELLQAQEGLKGMAAELQTLQMQLSKAKASKGLEAKSSKTTGAPVNHETPAAESIMAVHAKAAEGPSEKSPPKSVIAKAKEQPKKPPSKRQLAAHAAQAKPKQLRWKPQTTEDFLRVVAEHDTVFQPKSKPEAEAPQEMTAEEVEGLAELIEFNMHYHPDLFKSQKKPAKPTRKEAPLKSTPVLSAEQAALQSISALYDVLVHAWEADMKTRPAKVFVHSLASNRGPHGELMFLLPRMEEMRRPHEVMKIDFHTPAIIRNAGRTLAAKDVVDILRVYIGILWRVVGHFLPAEGVTIVTGRGVRTGARTFKAVGAELARLKAEGILMSDFYAHPDGGAYTIFIKSSPNLRKKGKR